MLFRSPDDIVPDKMSSIFEKLNTFCNRLLTTLIVEDIRLTTIDVIDTNTVDAGNIIVETVSFNVEDKLHLATHL